MPEQTAERPQTDKATAALVAELAHEAATTRRVLERVPEEKLSWAPHPKSMTLGQLALHVALLPGIIVEMVDGPTGEIPDGPRPEAGSIAELLETLDENVAAATRKLAEWGDARLREEWRLMRGGETLLAAPRGAMVRSSLFSHVYHHRGQLTVYLRLLDVPVPPIYGPSADEALFP